MGIKKLFKKIGMMIGSAGIVLAGAGGAYWSLENKNYQHNVLEFPTTFDHVAVVGDTGEDSPARANIVASIAKRPVKILLMAGDNCYEQGCRKESDWQKHIVRPFSKITPGLLAVLMTPGNHDNAALHEDERNFLQAKLANGPVDNVYMPNYDWGAVFSDYCLAVVDNTTFMSKKVPDIQEKWVAFVDKFISDKRCENKRLGLLWHIPVLSAGDHGDSKFKDQIAFYHKHLRGKVHDIFSGHDHNLSFDGCYQGTCHFLTGSGSKLRPIMHKARTWAASSTGYLYIHRVEDNRAYDFIEAKKGSDSVIFSVNPVIL